MDWASIGIGIGGILVTGATYYVGYRQTTGAEKERAKTANNQILRALYHNLILEERLPISSELKHIVTAKAIEHGVQRQEYMYSVATFLKLTLARLHEDDLLDSGKKKKLLEKTNAAIRMENLRNQRERARKATSATLWQDFSLPILSIGIGILLVFIFAQSLMQSATFSTSSFFIMLITMITAVFAMKQFVEIRI